MRKEFTEQLLKALRDAPLLPCFAVAMISAGAIVSDRWIWEQLLLAFLGLSLSLALSYFVTRKMMLSSAMRGFAAAGVHIRSVAAIRCVALMDRIIVLGVDLMRSRPQLAKPHQPHLDPRLRPLLTALAQHGRNDLCKLAVCAMAEDGIVPDYLTDVTIGPSGGVAARWRGHLVTLYMPVNKEGGSEMSLCLCIDGEIAGSYGFDECLRGEAAEVLAALKARSVIALIFDPNPIEMVACAARQLGVLVQADMSDAEQEQAIGRQLRGGHTPLVLTAGPDGNGFTLREGLLPNADADVLHGQNLQAVAAAVAISQGLQMSLKGAIATIGAVHLAALGAAVLGATAAPVAAAALGISLVLLMPMRHRMRLRCGLLTAWKADNVQKYSAI